MNKLARKLCFNDGYVLDSSNIFFASQLQEYANHDRSRVSIIIDGQWKYVDFDDAILSVACVQKKRLVFFMGHSGNILVGGLGKPVTEVISDIEEYGTILRIKNIKDRMYICGMSGQVYRRDHTGWIHIDDGVLGNKDVEFEDIDGMGDDDLYAVGMGGVVYHFNGKVWSRLDFPSNRPLSSVKCISKDEVYICGDNGGIFCGNLNNWRFIGDSSIDHNFWAIEKFRNKIYIAFDSGLYEYDGTSIAEVDFGIEGDVDGHRLHANDGVLWSIGIDNLLVFDGHKWKRVVCPMNV